MKLLPVLTVITAIGVFCAIASYSHGKYGPAWDKDDGYTGAQDKSMSDFVALQLPPSPSRMVYVWRDKKAAMLADAYSLRPENLDRTVDVRSMK